MTVFTVFLLYALRGVYNLQITQMIHLHNIYACAYMNNRHGIAKNVQILNVQFNKSLLWIQIHRKKYNRVYLLYLQYALSQLNSGFRSLIENISGLESGKRLNLLITHAPLV